MLRVRSAAVVALQRRLCIPRTITAPLASLTPLAPPKPSPFTPRTSAAAFASERAAAAAAQSAAAAAAPPLRFGSLFCPTRRDVPQDAVIPSHQLLIRGGFIRMVRAVRVGARCAFVCHSDSSHFSRICQCAFERADIGSRSVHAASAGRANAGEDRGHCRSRVRQPLIQPSLFSLRVCIPLILTSMNHTPTFHASADCKRSAAKS